MHRYKYVPIEMKRVTELMLQKKDKDLYVVVDNRIMSVLNASVEVYGMSMYDYFERIKMAE